MRKLIATLAIASLLAGVGAVAAFGATKTVNWKKPAKVTVKIHKKDTVKWVWGDKKQHNVRGPGLSSKFSSKKGHAVTKTFNSKGTFTYICDVHPTSMKTTVKVQ
jgi:plastocyanin